jgi:DNA invertase Pin-like site-specific DNA recombinase
MPKVRIIPAKKIIINNRNNPHSTKRRVAGYARVSTDSDEQFTSYEAQIEYYTDFIKSRPDWEFIKVYTDEGVSGTSTNRREGFKQMINDALLGEIDLIVTKSVSRFARNTVDSLTTIRMLKEKNVECYFEKENIWTFDGKGELLITIMSSIAQEESRSISENTTWGKRKQAKDGKVSVPYSNFLGYDKGPDGNMVVNEEQAELVRLIYALFLQGKSPNGIAEILTEKNIPSPGRGKQWVSSCIKSILQNEKYIGDALLQKSFTVDFLTHKQKVNEGEVPQYYVEDHHEPIVSKEMFALVQTEMKRRDGMPGRRNRRRMLSGRILCAQCGSWFGEKKWHPNSKYQKVVWQCNGKYDKAHSQCTSGNLIEQDVQRMFVIAVNRLLKDSSNILETQKLVYDTVFDTAGLERERTALIADMSVTAELMDRMSSGQPSSRSNEYAHTQEFQALQIRYEQAEKRKEELDNTIQDKVAKKALATSFFDNLKKQNSQVVRFDEDLWNGLVDHLKVYSPNDVRFIFRDGSEIKVDLSEEEKKRPPLTEKQMTEIRSLRRDGMSYAKIGEKLNLPRGQVRSFCLSRTSENEAAVQEDGEPVRCKTCGKELEHTPGFRKKIFCSDGCRQDWWNRYAKIQAGEGWATNEVICQNCGEKFVTYGTKRKYCSRKCYTEHMWQERESRG